MQKPKGNKKTAQQKSGSQIDVGNSTIPDKGKHEDT